MRKTIERKKESAADEGPCYIKCLPPEVMEEILLQLSVRDVVNFGATCTTYRDQLCQSSFLWRRIYNRMPVLWNLIPEDYRHLAILRSRQALYIKTLGLNHPPTRVTVEQALGYRRVKPTSNTVVLLGYQGTLCLLWRQRSTDILSTDILSTNILCHGVLDFDVHYCHIYALLDGRIRVFQDDGAVINNLPIETENKTKIETAPRFTQIRYSTKYSGQCGYSCGLVLLTDSGKLYPMSMMGSRYVYAFPSNNNLINLYNIRQIHTCESRILFLTAEGKVYLEDYSWYHQPLRYQSPYIPVHLQLPSKVVKCSIGKRHLCLVDEYGHIYTQGWNECGQLGTGDRKDSSQPTQVALSMTAIDVWCGDNHTLALLQGESGLKEVHGCGSGTGGHLPGWSEGSPSFVKLNVQVPPASHSLCASEDFLYVLSGPDVTEYLHPPPPVQPVATF